MTGLLGLGAIAKRGDLQGWRGAWAIEVMDEVPVGFVVTTGKRRRKNYRRLGIFCM